MNYNEFPILEIHRDITYRCSFFNSHLGISLKESDFASVPKDGYLDIPEDMELILSEKDTKHPSFEEYIEKYGR